MNPQEKRLLLFCLPSTCTFTTFVSATTFPAHPLLRTPVVLFCFRFSKFICVHGRCIFSLVFFIDIICHFIAFNGH